MKPVHYPYSLYLKVEAQGHIYIQNKTYPSWNWLQIHNECKWMRENEWILGMHVLLPHIECLPHSEVEECFDLDEPPIISQLLLPSWKGCELIVQLADVWHTLFTDGVIILFINVWMTHHPKKKFEKVAQILL